MANVSEKMREMRRLGVRTYGEKERGRCSNGNMIDGGECDMIGRPKLRWIDVIYIYKNT